jgi:8-oxo-dGTP pyrophosphatase MutT (NUDIX family)
MSGFLRHIRALNAHRPEDFYPLWIGEVPVGRLCAQMRERLLAEPQVFEPRGRGLALHGRLSDYRSRTQAVAEVLPRLVDEGELDVLLDEPYPVTASGPDAALMEVDRAAAALFGLRTFGQHLNGLVPKDGSLCMWLARRSADRRVHPGKLDQLVAGGLPVGISAAENLLKEAWEEAGIEPGLAGMARPAGALSYNQDVEYGNAKKGYKYDVLYCYDLFLPQSFQPRCQDGEVESFELLPVEEVMGILSASDDFKPNCSLVVLDCLVRHGYLGPEHPDYLEIVTSLCPPMVPINTTS